jgi:hypothetical protein
MALDYHTVPSKYFISSFWYLTDSYTCTGTSVDVERVFSQGRLLLPYIRNRLSAASTRALLCVGAWSRQRLVRDSDLKAAAVLPDVNGEEPPLATDWDVIA